VSQRSLVDQVQDQDIKNHTVKLSCLGGWMDWFARQIEMFPRQDQKAMLIKSNPSKLASSGRSIFLVDCGHAEAMWTPTLVCNR
jgi:hypothetical protein